MSSREVFDQWCLEQDTIYATECNFLVWQAACEYQKQKDAEICREDWNGDSDTYEYAIACNECAEAILNQGDE